MNKRIDFLKNNDNSSESQLKYNYFITNAVNLFLNTSNNLVLWHNLARIKVEECNELTMSNYQDHYDKQKNIAKKLRSDIILNINKLITNIAQNKPAITMLNTRDWHLGHINKRNKLIIKLNNNYSNRYEAANILSVNSERSKYNTNEYLATMNFNYNIHTCADMTVNNSLKETQSDNSIVELVNYNNASYTESIDCSDDNISCTESIDCSKSDTSYAESSDADELNSDVSDPIEPRNDRQWLEFFENKLNCVNKEYIALKEWFDTSMHDKRVKAVDYNKKMKNQCLQILDYVRKMIYQLQYQLSL